jgi:hypothetical protein
MAVEAAKVSAGCFGSAAAGSLSGISLQGYVIRAVVRFAQQKNIRRTRLAAEPATLMLL